MLSKDSFARGMQLINSILSKNAQIEVSSTIDSYYFLLNDLPDKHFLLGVVDLMKNWKNPHYIPGPGEIRESVEKIMFSGLSKEEYKLVLKAYELTGIPVSDHKILENLNDSDTNKYLLENN